MKSNLDLALDSFCSSYAKTVVTGGWGRWPAPYITSPEAMTMIDPYFIDYFTKIIKKIERKGLSYEEVAQNVPYPSPLSRILFISRALKVHKYPTEKLLQTVTFVAEVMARKYQQDFFCAKGSNILLTPADIKNRVNNKSLEEINPTLPRLNGLLWLYTELLYMYFHNYGHEIHGPYPYGQQQLLIREWHNLKPDFFDFSTEFPYEKIIMYELYDKSLSITFDISNRMNSSKPIDRHIKKFYVEIDGKRVNDLSKLNTRVENAITTAVQSFEKTTRSLLFPKLASIHFSVLKPFAELVGMSSKPTKACLDRVAEDKLTDYEKDMLAKIKAMKIDDPKVIRRFFDPRVPLEI